MKNIDTNINLNENIEKNKERTTLTTNLESIYKKIDNIKQKTEKEITSFSKNFLSGIDLQNEQDIIKRELENINTKYQNKLDSIFEEYKQDFKDYIYLPPSMDIPERAM